MPAGTNLYNLGTNQRSQKFESEPHLFVMSDGYVLALWGSGTDTLYAAYNGTTWTAGTSTGLGLDLVPPPGGSGDISIQKNGDTVVVWRITNTGTTLNVRQFVLPWNATTHALGTVLASATYAIATGATSIGSIGGAACWDSAASLWRVLVTWGNNGSTVSLGNTLFYGFAQITTNGQTLSPSSSNTTQSLFGGESGGSVQLVMAAGASTYFLTTATACWPVTASTGVAGTRETVYTAGAASPMHTTRLDASSNIDWVIHDGTKIVTVKRTGTNSYSAATTLTNTADSSFSSGPCATFNASTGDLWVTWTVAGTVSGSLRRSGQWQTPQVFAGNDGSTYAYPSAARFTNSNGDLWLTYAVGASSPYALYALQVLGGHAPNQPVVTSPVGNISTTTPTFGYQYSNPASQDAANAYEFKFTRVSDAFVMWDTGKVFTLYTSGFLYGNSGYENPADPNWVTATALTYGVQYQVQARSWDTMLNAVSAWSNPVTFTPVRPGTVVITALTDSADGTISSFPATVGTNALSFTATWSQPDGNSANAYAVTILDSTGSVVIDSLSSTPISPVTASGSSFVTATFTATHMVNTGVYKVKVSATDAVTGITTDSALAQITGNWAAPNAAGGFTVTPVTETGLTPYMLASWTLPTSGPAIASVAVLRRRSGTTAWTTVFSGQPRSTLQDYCPLNTAFDYALQMTSTLGGTTALQVYSNVTLGPQFGKLGWCYNRIDDATQGVSFGHTSDPRSSSEIDDNYGDILMFVPPGRTAPIVSYSPTNYQSTTTSGQTFLLPPTVVGRTGSTTSLVQIATLRSIAGAKVPILMRNPDGDALVVTINIPPQRRVVTGPIKEIQFGWVEISGGSNVLIV